MDVGFARTGIPLLLVSAVVALAGCAQSPEVSTNLCWPVEWLVWQDAALAQVAFRGSGQGNWSVSFNAASAIREGNLEQSYGDRFQVESAAVVLGEGQGTLWLFHGRPSRLRWDLERNATQADGVAAPGAVAAWLGWQQNSTDRAAWKVQGQQLTWDGPFPHSLRIPDLVGELDLDYRWTGVHNPTPSTGTYTLRNVTTQIHFGVSQAWRLVGGEQLTVDAAGLAAYPMTPRAEPDRATAQVRSRLQAAGLPADLADARLERTQWCS